MSNDDIAELRQHTDGKWASILSKLGVEHRVLTKKNMPCPNCGGRDRFRFTDHDDAGCWICNQCGRGNGFQLLMMYHKIGFVEAVERVKSVLGIATKDKAVDRTPEQQLADMRYLWKSSLPVTNDCPVGRYLARRGIEMNEYPGCLRWVKNLRNGSQEFPAMLAQVISPDGDKAVNIHRTWVTEDGEKAPVDVCRKLMPGTLPKGSAIRLLRADGGRLGVAEGLETALRASLKFGIPAWSCINEGNLQAFTPPEDITELHVFGDNDLSFVGQAAAFITARDVARDCARKKREIAVKVEIPMMAGTDWADESSMRIAL